MLFQEKSKDIYTHFKHQSFQDKEDYSDLYSINQQEFHNDYPHIARAFSAGSVWIKKLSLNNKVIGNLFLACNNDASLSTLQTAYLVELSERFSTIYTTHKQKAALFYKANFDSLTNLSNRNHLLECLRNKWPITIKRGTTLALFYIDLDNFKSVNDLSGHQAGNEVLKEVAERISNYVDDNAIFARLSGDEFCILYESLSNNREIQEVANNILDQFKSPFKYKDMYHFLGASIGITVGPGNCESPDIFVERADIAMYKAKQEGKNRYVIYNSDIEQERSYRLSLEQHLHFALQENEISIQYQPKIDLNNGRMTSVECLARWNQRLLGFVPTDKFIALAEESGLINEIGTWILRKSCYQYADWLEKGIILDSIAVNVSARQLVTRNFDKVVASAIEESGIEAHNLELEITESAFINDDLFLKNELTKLHKLGVKISIDDFGKEYSSLSYLKKIPFDTLKIDREFIIDLETDHRDQHIIDVIINIGHTLGKKIVAEGIETIEQRNILKKYGCDIGQGYLFSRPLKDIEFLEFATKYINEGMGTKTLKALNE